MKSYPETNYDIKHIENIAKGRFFRTLALHLICVITAAASVIAIILYSNNLAVFVSAAVVLIISLFILTKKLKRLNISTLRTSVGKISDAEVEIRTERLVVGGVGLRARPYDKYKKETTSIGIFIEEKDGITPYYLHKAKEKHVEYYRSRARVMRIFATEFPIKLDPGEEAWVCTACKTENEARTSACINCRCHRSTDILCPLCGEFSPADSKSCAVCKTRILK